jgi:hypothetical protein
VDIRLDQLVVILLVVLFTLGDAVYRRLRNRGRAAPPEGEELHEGETAVADADVEAAYEEEIRHGDGSEPEDVFEPPAEEELPAPAHRPPALPPPEPERPAPVALARRRTAALPSPLDAREARRAIVLMTVLGPCRGLESEDRAGGQGPAG